MQFLQVNQLFWSEERDAYVGASLSFISIGLEAYSVGTWYWGYLLLRNFASSGTLVLAAQQMYRPEADSFSATNIWARQTSSTCAIDIEPDSICIPFNAFMRNSLPENVKMPLLHQYVNPGCASNFSLWLHGLIVSGKCNTVCVPTSRSYL